MDRLRDIAIFIRNVMTKYGFKTKEVGYQYSADSLESSFLTSIEGIMFMDGTGYIFVAGRDTMEYASSDPNLSIAWDGSRPNVKYTITGIRNEQKYIADTMAALDQGGGYIRHQWMGMDQVTYVLPIDDYLYIGVAFIPARATANTLSDRSYVMSSFVAQMISRFIITNVWKTLRYEPFLNAIKAADPRIRLHEGYIERTNKMAHTPYYPMTVEYL